MISCDDLSDKGQYLILVNSTRRCELRIQKQSEHTCYYFEMYSEVHVLNTLNEAGETKGPPRATWTLQNAGLAGQVLSTF